MRWIVAVSCLALIAGCASGQADSSDPDSSPVGFHGETSFATPGYASGGLGLSFADWSARWRGEPIERADGLHYDAGDAEIVIAPPLVGNVWNIAIDWRDHVSLDAARTAVAAMLPHDAAMDQSEPIDNGIREHWHSPSLATRFPAEETITTADGKRVVLNTWNDGQPGDFTVTITVLADGSVPGVIMAIGDHS